MLFKKCEIKTKLSKQQISDKIKDFADAECKDYYASASDNGFFIGEKPIKHSAFVHTRNSFAPVAKAKMIEENGITTVSLTTRMHLLALILFYPIYFASLITVVFYPLVLLLLRFAFFKPMAKLEEALKNLLTDF